MTSQRPADAIDSVWARRHFTGPIIAAGNYTRETALKAASDGTADAVAVGRGFLANPDLPERLRLGAGLNEAVRDTFYGGDDRGYIAYPSLEAEGNLAELRERAPHDLPHPTALDADTRVDQWPLAWARADHPLLTATRAPLARPSAQHREPIDVRCLTSPCSVSL